MWAAPEELESKISSHAGFGAERTQFSGESRTPKIFKIFLRGSTGASKSHAVQFLDMFFQGSFCTTIESIAGGPSIVS